MARRPPPTFNLLAFLAVMATLTLAPDQSGAVLGWLLREGGELLAKVFTAGIPAPPGSG